MGLFDRFRSGSTAELRQKIEELKKRLKANPGSLTVALALADALHESGATREGVKLLAELGPVLQKKAQFLGAIAAYKKIAEIDPEGASPDAAAARSELKRLEDAASTRTLPAVGPPKAGGSAEEAGAQQKRDSIHPLLGSIPLFKDIPIYVVDQLIEKIHLRTFDAGQTVVEEGAPGSSLLFIVSGEIAVTGRDETGADVPLRTLGPGDVAGEISFLSSLPRSASLRTKAPTALLELERRAVDPLVRKSPHLKEALQNLYRKRVLNDVLVRSSLFGSLPKDVRDSIATFLRPAAFAVGERIHPREGRPEALFLIAQGLVKIMGVERGQFVERAILSPPAFFGNVGRVADAQTLFATGVTDVELFTLDHKDLKPILARCPNLWAAVDEIQMERLGSASPTSSEKR